MPDKSALVMQRGIADVKAFMPKVGGKLEGQMLYDCATTALACVQALHGAKLVWNDLKTENFVVIEDNTVGGGGYSFKGIDLESCMPVRECPVDYTPEACPPEFARAFLAGEADTFLLEYSYDVWYEALIVGVCSFHRPCRLLFTFSFSCICRSYGMFLYEISTGRGFFDGYTAEKITKMLPDFEPNVDNVPDPQLADLISKCLAIDPKSRPSFVRISRHPYFTGWSSNKTPFDFLFGSSI
jgi:serine/threonine protein kinase